MADMFARSTVLINATCKSDYRRRFGLMTGFIGLFGTQRVTTLYMSLVHTLVATATSSLPFLGSGFQRRSPYSGFPYYPGLQLPASHSNS
jgi:hypothetical protein